jgi:hypothetical protein
MNTEQKEWVLENMRYNQETGVLERWFRNCRWKEVPNKPGNHGYATVGVLGASQLAHRVAWLLVHGDIDDSLEIDHINGVRNDNRLCNLRLDTHRKNDQNLECHRNGKLVGACWYKPTEKWVARIYINGNLKHLGYFSTELEAHQAYMAACAKLNEPSIL